MERETFTEMMRMSSTIAELRKENRLLSDELKEVRPLARLAHLMSILEGDTQRFQRELIRNDQDIEDIKATLVKLDGRLTLLEQFLFRAVTSA